MKYIIYILLLTSITTYSQTGTVKGKVVDKITKETLPYVNVVIQTGNTIVTGGITDGNGAFVIKSIPYRNYAITIQYIGYKTETIEVTLSANKKVIDIGTVYIEEDALTLDTIEITTERSTIEQKIDRKVINVGKDLTTLGASVGDMMGNIPSVSVNQDGEISLRGNENVRILVDGKPTNISSADLLQQIPSTSIKKIELITNPSAKYNPEGMSGIINIILKKNTNLGFNGSISSGITFAQKTRYNSALSLNYRAGKFNVYASYGNRFGNRIIDGTVTRTEENTNQLTKLISDNTSHLIKIGVDYFIDDKNTFSAYTNQNLFKNSLTGSKDITFYDDISLNFSQLDDVFRKKNNATYNTDFKHNFVKEGHNIELEFDYNELESEDDNGFGFTGNSPLNDYGETIEDSRTNTTINLDYVNPISENSKLEIGVETRLRRTDNTYNTTNVNLNNSGFSYNRDIYSFYTTWSQNLEKWSYNLGLRLEDYSVDALFAQADGNTDVFKNDLFNIYPSGFLKFTPDKEGGNSYQFSFSKRIDRPSLNQINPIRQISTPQIIIVGNQSLNPQFTNSIELNYSRKINNGNLSFGTFYRKIKDEINRIGYFDDDNPTLLVIDYENFDSNHAYGFEFSASYKPTQWWNFNSSFDVYSRTQKGIIEGENIKVNNTLLNLKLNNSFKATKDLTFQMFTTYSGKQKILQYELKEIIFVNVGARYNFAKDKGTLSVNFNDIFKTQRFAFEAYRTIKQTGEFVRDTQSIYFGFSYRFGGGNGKSAKRKRRDKFQKADKFL